MNGLKIFGAIIMGMFVYVGANQLMNNVVTGTSVGEVLLMNVVPIALAGAVLAVVVGIFR